MIHKRRPELHQTKTGHERWLVSYADFITLLFAFFVVMYSVSQVSEQKYRTLADTLANVFEGQVPVTAPTSEVLDQYPLDDKGEVSGLSPEINLVDTATLAKELEEVLVNLVEPKDITISATEEWVQIDVNANLLFASASADPSPEARRIFAQVGNLLAGYDNEIEVAGYTDNIPITTALYSSNWDLSAARAVSVVKLLTSHSVAAERLSAVGFGEFRPITSNQDEQGRAQNRRVVLKVARHQSSASLRPPLKSSNSVPTSLPETTQDPAPETTVEPVRLRNGGLLFSSDPDLPRRNNE